ncbi:kinase-like domain-containing protein [Aspergillus coremiiformis]|uniref:Altered inheritance of mitochondria protein 9, mitochondrial n=1 Tax=Aspergillus coremiiformis TaxID=138285 RepID=A0A5N6Z7E3_9EURO|nr:kinase-like domain-containing protein [Aspergillus coremiiformis]
MLRMWRQLRLVPSFNINDDRFFSFSRRKLSDMGSKHGNISALPLPETAPPKSGLDPHSYTGGRWLNRDELERKSRHVAFDFSALCDRAICACPGATRIVKYEKREGGFNRVFIITMDNGRCVVARVPTSIAGPPRLTTNSEVATMTYLRSKTSLPIPKVLDWNDNPSNPIGTEYIIQEHVAGVQLHQIWPKMNSEQHMLCTKTLSLMIKEMASLDFPAYGSLYFADAPLDSDSKVSFEQGFCVGPHCGPIFWNRSPGEVELYGGSSPNCGPWKDLSSYSRGLIETGLSRLPKEEAIDNRELLPHQGSIQDHLSLLQISQKIMQKLTQDKRIQNAATPALLHLDFHKRNIYVSAEEPTVITALIDWQSASIEPAFIYANETPDFAAFPEMPDEDSPEENQGEQQTSGSKEREWKDASICYQTYDVCMKGFAPKLRPARLLDPTLFRLFQYIHTTWRDTAPAVRQELIELSARWEELGLQGSCPFTATEEEVKKHAQDYEDFQTVQKLKLWLKSSLHTNSDGWVPNEAWDAAREAHRAAYDEWIQTAKEAETRGEDLTVAKADKLWPFDAR